MPAEGASPDQDAAVGKTRGTALCVCSCPVGSGRLLAGLCLGILLMCLFVEFRFTPPFSLCVPSVGIAKPLRSCLTGRLIVVGLQADEAEALSSKLKAEVRSTNLGSAGLSSVLPSSSFLCVLSAACTRAIDLLASPSCRLLLVLACSLNNI
jgi:hypothetical protein